MTDNNRKTSNSDAVDVHCDAFQKDLMEILIEKSSRDPVPRRLFLKTAAFLGISSALYKITPAFAGQNEIVVVNWGGDAIEAKEKVWVSLYNKKYPDTKVVINGSGPSSGKIKAMVESGKVTWDLCDRNNVGGIDLGTRRQNAKGLEGFLESQGLSGHANAAQELRGPT